MNDIYCVLKNLNCVMKMWSVINKLYTLYINKEMPVTETLFFKWGGYMYWQSST